MMVYSAMEYGQAILNDLEKENELKNMENWEVPHDASGCSVCLTRKLNVISCSARHSICVECYRTAIAAKLQITQNILVTTCLTPQCLRDYRQDEVNYWLPAVVMKKREEKQYLERMIKAKNYICHCGSYRVAQQAEETMTCLNCNNIYCKNCNFLAHGENPCFSELQAWQKEKSPNTRLCPQCGQLIEKNEGCKRMTHCGVEFCWDCGIIFFSHNNLRKK